MQSRLEAITKLFKDNLCYDDFDPGQIVEISNCTTPQLFEKMMQDYQVLKQNFQKELIEILLAEVQNSEDKIDSSVSYKDIFQYQDLKKFFENVNKLKGSFSYKQIKRIQLKLFCLLHSQLLSQNNLQKYEDINLREQISLLQQSIKRESKWSGSFEQTFIKLAKTQDFSNLLAILQDIKKQLMIINIDQLVNLINKSKAAQNKMYNGCGIVFIGSTGAGKTTTILSLLGHLIENKKWAGINWATPKYLLNIEGVKNLVACPNSKSVTRNVTAIEVPNKKMFTNQNIYFIDTPGFKDTQGSIMDLSNTFGTSHAIKSLKKAKFIVLLSGKDQGSRNQGLVEITEILNQLFPNYNKIKNSVVLFFNRYNQSDMECISGAIVNVWKSLSQSSQHNPNLQDIFNDFREKTSKKETHFVFDPIGKDKSYSQKINKAIEEYPWVTNLDELFSVCYGERAKKDIEKQVTNLKDYCLYYFKVGEIQIAKYFIQQLEQLRDILGKELAPQVVSNNFKIIQTRMLEQINKKNQIILRQFIKAIDACSLSQKDIEEYMNNIRELDIYLTLEQYIDITDIKNRLNIDVDNKINSIVCEAKQQISRINEKSMRCLALLVKAFKRNDCYEQICSVLDLEIKQKMSLYKGKIQVSDFDESVEFYEKSKLLANLYSVFIGSNEEIEKKFEIDNIILTEIREQQNFISSFVENFGDCSIQKFKEIKRVSTFITKLEVSLKFLRAISNYQSALQLAKEFRQFITKKAVQTLQQCEDYLTGKQNLSPATVNKISKFYDQILQMKQIPHLEKLVINKSKAIDSKIASCLDNEKKVVEGFIEQMKGEKINFVEIKREVRRLDQSALRIQRVLQFQPNFQENTLDDVANKIKYFFQDNLNKVQSMRKSKKNIFDDKHNQFQKLGQIVQMLEAFNLQQKKQGKSKLLQRQELMSDFREIKQKSQNIFTNKFSEIEKITNKLIEEGKQKLDTQPFKYSNVKFKQIELCLNFIELGKKIFGSIQQKYVKFEHAQAKLVEQIKKWESQLMESLEILFQKLKDTQKQDFKLSVKQLKKKILILKEIKEKYNLLENLLQPSTQAYVQQELSQQINEIIKIHQKSINRFVQLQNPVDQISYLIAKCQTLSTLDCFIDENSNFKKLEQNIQKKIQNFTKKLDDKFKFALNIKNYDDVLNILQLMSSNEKELYDECESQFCKVVQKQITEIMNKKKKENNTQNYLEFIVEELGELNKIRKDINSNQKMRTKNILQLQSSINETIESLSADVESYYFRFVQQTKNKIQQGRIYQAHVQISQFNKKKGLLSCSQIKQKINISIIEQLEKNIYQVLKNFEAKYINNPQPDLSKFGEEYEEIFPHNMSSGQFSSLKNKIEKVIDNLIQKKEKEIDQKSCFNKFDLTQIKNFVNQLPEYFKNKIQCQNLHKLARERHQKWEKEKETINSTAQQLIPFQNRVLNRKIIVYFKDKQLDKNTQQVLLTNLTNELDKIKEQLGKDLNSFVQKLIESKQLQSLKKLQNEQGLEEISKVYKTKSAEIEQELAQLFVNQVFKIQQLTVEPKLQYLKDNQLKVKVQDLITALFKSLFLLENKYSLSQNLKQSFELRITQYVRSLIQNHKKNVSLINNMKTCLDFQEETSKIQQQIRQIKYVYIVEYSFFELIKKGETEGYANKYIKQIVRMIKQYQKDLMIEKYKTIVKDEIMPKYEQCINFSLQSKAVSLMSENDLKKVMRQLDCCKKYLTIHLVHLLDSIGKNNEVQKLLKLNEQNMKIQQQANSMVEQILEYAKQPSIDDKKVQHIKTSRLIIKIFSEYYLKFKQTEKTYIKQIQKCHSDKNKQIQDLLNKQKQKAESYEKERENKRNQMVKAIKTQEDKVKAAFKQKLEKMKKKHEIQINDLPEQQKQKIKNTYLTEVKQQNTLQNQQITKISTDYKKQFFQTQEKYFQEIKDVFKEITEQFIIMTTITNNFTSDKVLNDRNKKIIDSIYKIGKKKWLQIFINCLNEVGSTTAKLIIYDNPSLNQLTQNHFMKNIQSLDIDQLISKMAKCNPTMSEAFKNKLKKVYASCKTHYQTWLSSYKSHRNPIKNNLTGQLKQPRKVSEQAKNQEKIKKIASILALWTIIQSIQQDGDIIYSYNPHPVQFITLIILLGLVDMKQCEGYKNRFAEVKTGEGKSLILAAMSVYFALDKYSVDCVCYSKHLSSRDKGNFQQLFELLEVKSQINYCTFNDLTETLLEKGEINLREQCTNLSKKNVQKNRIVGKFMSFFNSDKATSENKILLLDEADVFFMDQFYGNTYTPSFQLKSDHIKNLYSLIWEKRNQLNQLVNQIQKLPQFLNIVQQFPQFAQLIKNHLPHMFEAAENFKHSYLTENDRIQYRDQDGYSDKISYGYRTIFAYFYQFGKKNISKLPDEVCSLNLRICQISYAELPKIYTCIIGVTGTLSSLSECKLKVMKEKYKINENYIIPSIYKESKRDDKGYCIVQTQLQFQEIQRNLARHLNQSKPILIFFANLDSLNSFYHSKSFEPHQKQTVILYERHNTQQRRTRIMRATTPGKITLLTSSFGRGTDFIIYEDKVIEKGGVHIIVTYLPEDKSQEVQLLGRVGRQGNPGSSIIILSSSQIVSKLGQQNRHLIKQNSDKIQEALLQIRETESKDKYNRLSSEIDTCLTKHNESLKLFNEIKNRQFDDVFKKIIQMNYLPVLYTKKPVKTILALDATGSMSGAIVATKSSLSQSFERVYHILQQNKVQSGFLIQIVLFRNYNVKQDQLIEMSPFESTAESLVNFITKVSTKGGMGNQASQVVFDYCLKVQDLKQLIVVTDALPNTQQEIILKRKYHSGDQTYWSKTQNFKRSINLHKVKTTMKQKGIVVNALPIGNHLKQFYTNLCIQNGGLCQLFNPKHKDHVDTMTNFIATSILSKLGEDQKVGDKLVESYKKTYNK